MAGNSRAPAAELQETGRRGIGTNPEIVRKVKIETRSSRLEEKLLALTRWRMYLLNVKTPAKIESTFNFLEIRNLTPVNSDKVLIETEKTSYSVVFESPGDLDRVMGYVNHSLRKIFPTLPQSGSDRNIPENTQQLPLSPQHQPSNLALSSSCCGGFSETYAALCDYNGVPCREEVQWDVDTIYHSQDTRHFNILDFSHLNSRDLALIVAALAYNQWFTKLSTKDLKLGSEVIEQVIHTMSRSQTIEELEMESTGLKVDFAVRLAAALTDNPFTALTALSLSCNPLEDKGVSSLSQFLAGHHRGLRYLNLSRTSLTQKGLVPLAQTLSCNQSFADTLTHLDLSKNTGMLAGDDASYLYNFLARPNVLVDLNLSGTDCAIDVLFGALLHGCSTHLNHLHLSNNLISHRKAKETLPSMKTFFGCAFSLSYVNFSGTKMAPEALSALFQGLALNSHLTDLHLDLSSCELRAIGAAVIGEYIGENFNISSLELADNGFEGEMVSLLTALRRNRTIRHLGIGKNFNVKTRTLEEILHVLVQLFQDEGSGLRSLSVANSRLKSQCTVLINALGSNSSLTNIDLSGNSIGDLGTKMLAKALLINNSLRTLSWDRNNVTAAGFLDIAHALENNYTLKVMPIPLNDLSQTYRHNPEKTEEALQKIQEALLRNSRGRSYSENQAFRLQQGLRTRTAEQMMDRLCVKVHNDLNRLKNCPIDSVQRDSHLAENIIRDARNARALFPSLYDLGHVLSIEGPIRQKLDSVSRDVSEAVNKEVQMLMDSMLVLSRELCPLAMDRAESRQRLGTVTAGLTLSRSFVRGVLLENAGPSIHRKLSEVMLAVVMSLTNCITDEILQELYRSHKTLSQHVVQLQRRRQEEALPLELNQDQSTRGDLIEAEEGTDDELSLSIDTLAIRRQTAHCRRIRPVSTFLSASELEVDRTCEDDSVSGRVSTSTVSSQQSQSLETLTDLPTEGHKLEHQTRIRPKPHRNNRQPPSTNGPAAKGEENGGGSRLDEGLDGFYKWEPIADCAEAPRAEPQAQSDIPLTSGPKKPRPRQRAGMFKFMRGRAAREDGLTVGSRASEEEAEDEEEEEVEEEEEEEEEEEGVRRTLPAAAQAPSTASRRGAGKDGPPSQIVARRVQGVPLPGMGGSQNRQLTSDSMFPAEQSIPKAGSHSNGQERREVLEWPVVPLVPRRWAARGQNGEAPDTGGQSQKRTHRVITDRRDPQPLPPPPPPPPQETKPNRNMARCREHPGTAGMGDAPSVDLPTNTLGFSENCAPSDSNSHQEEGDRKTRRVLLPPTSRIPGTTKLRQQQQTEGFPQPPRPPPAESKPRPNGQKVEGEEETREEEGRLREVPPSGRGVAPEEDTEGSAHSDGTERTRRREAPIKPRRSRRGHVKPRLPSDSCSLSDNTAPQCNTDGEPGQHMTVKPPKPALKQKPFLPGKPGETVALSQRPDTRLDPGRESGTPGTETVPDGLRDNSPENSLNYEDDRSQSDV